MVVAVVLAVGAAACGESTTEVPDDLGAVAFVDYDCRRGFNLGSRDGTLHVEVVWPSQPFPYDEPERVLGRHELPSQDWRVRLHVGASLFDNWCNDVGGSDRRVDTTLTATGGVLEIIELPAEYGGLPDGRGRLLGVTFAGPDGPLELGSQIGRAHV